MNDKHLKPLSAAVLRLLRPLVRILLRNGVSYAIIGHNRIFVGFLIIFRVLSASVRWAKNFLKRAVRGRVAGFAASTLPSRIEAR